METTSQPNETGTGKFLEWFIFSESRQVYNPTLPHWRQLVMVSAAASCCCCRLLWTLLMWSASRRRPTTALPQRVHTNRSPDIRGLGTQENLCCKPVFWIQKTLNLDPDTGFWPNLDLDPDPGLPYVFNFGEKKIKNSFGGNKFLYTNFLQKKLSEKNGRR